MEADCLARSDAPRHQRLPELRSGGRTLHQGRDLRRTMRRWRQRVGSRSWRRNGRSRRRHRMGTCQGLAVWVERAMSPGSNYRGARSNAGIHEWWVMLFGLRIEDIAASGLTAIYDRGLSEDRGGAKRTSGLRGPHLVADPRWPLVPRPQSSIRNRR